MKLWNRYLFFARYLPALITISPLSLLYFFVTKRYNGFSLKEYVESMAFAIGISATFVFTYFVTMVVRELGSRLEKKYFKGRSGFPSNYLMLYSHPLISRSFKEKFRQKMINDFDLQSLTEAEEIANPAEALSALSQASLILSTKYQQHDQIKDANIAYGFVRNLSGGLYISIPSSTLSLSTGLYLQISPLAFWSSVTALLFILIAIFHKAWMVSNAEKYANKLFAVFLSDK